MLLSRCLSIVAILWVLPYACADKAVEPAASSGTTPRPGSAKAATSRVEEPSVAVADEPPIATAAAIEETAEALPLGMQTIEFPSEDGLAITADLYVYHEDPSTPIIVLFHQAGWSRGEYREIAPRLGAAGFNAIAVDQRSGKSVKKVENQTYKRATAAKKKTSFVAALPDIRSALRYAKERFPDALRIAWGSSYSSALVIVVASENPELVDATMSFAPGEYFERFGKSKTYVQDAAAKLKVPAFVTSAKSEHRNWKKIYQAIPGQKVMFLPTTKGNHGSKALWEEFKDSGSYWNEVHLFLEAMKRQLAPAKN